MNLEKTDELHIHLDGNLNNSTLFHGYVGWSQFDIQHPKAPFVTDKTKAAIHDAIEGFVNEVEGIEEAEEVE
mgnify:CR=1 FL=1